MDTTEKFNVVEFCAGYAGIGLGLKRVIRDIRTVATDELRMLGNGVVPATAERAFRVLYSELTRQDIPELYPKPQNEPSGSSTENWPTPIANETHEEIRKLLS